MSELSGTLSELPKSVVVSNLLSSRYSQGVRPASWDDRIAGIDIIKATDGNVYHLSSDGQQSPPKKGWNIILREGDNRLGYRWTLFGMSNVTSTD